MPIIPTPPPMTVTQRLQAIATNTNGVVNIAQPNSNVAQQIKDIAEQTARMVLNEYLKTEREKENMTKLRIKNINNLVGHRYDGRLVVTGVLEENKYYEFHLNNNRMNQPETILLHRRQTDSGHYIMEYNGKTLWVTKDEIDMPEKIIICMQTI